METKAGPVPIIKTRLTAGEWMSTTLVRCGINRHNYTLCPGLYGVGQPHEGSEVLVTANFKLSFDHLRRTLSGINAWILVLDTRGINVWCAAGKGSFDTKELVSRIKEVKLDSIVAHKRLILPQLGATGVNAKEVKALSKFRVIYGPVRAKDLPLFLKNNKKADPFMRQVTFTFLERLILTPVEVQILFKPAIIATVVLFILSGIGPGIFSFTSAWTRTGYGLYALAGGIFSGAVITPILLPWIPVRAFALKGILLGSAAGAALVWKLCPESISFSRALALFLFTTATSSFLAMNFTGTTPFTSPSGVEKEMKQYIPVQMILMGLSTGLWIYSGF
ncbi:MAG: hypothetical protein HUN05_21415 [Desulfobacter sp.]|nr:MAG: hypothetical protein HUN05_21415 [Desulfobacter sp.]